MNGAWGCVTSGSCNSDFKVLGADFKEPFGTVEDPHHHARGEQAMDPVDLWVFNDSGQRILRCWTNGIDQGVLNSGVLLLPVDVYSGIVCGKVIQKKNCSGDPGNCDYVVEMRVQRRVGDIAFVWFGGPLWGDIAYANADALTYTAGTDLCVAGAAASSGRRLRLRQCVDLPALRALPRSEGLSECQRRTRCTSDLRSAAPRQGA